jgi:hypothetical protein
MSTSECLFYFSSVFVGQFFLGILAVSILSPINIWTRNLERDISFVSRPEPSMTGMHKGWVDRRK